ncbi:MAG: hypothetical protein O7B99_14620 [Planctomycetota bacterium]|nr:hypothetical protein [Planctomycetota bacterium]
MKSTIGSVLLVIGTILGGIAAANSARASRWVALEEEGAHPGEFLFRDVARPKDPSDPMAQIPGESLATAGTELTQEVVATLVDVGLTRVLVRDPAYGSETVSAGDREAYRGRVLAADVRLGSEVNTIPSNRRVTRNLLDRLRAAGVESLRVMTDEEAVEIDLAPEADPERYLGAKTVEEMKLEEPVVVPAGAFVDDQVEERIAAADIEEVSLAVRKKFTLLGWEQKWLFLLAAVAMVVGVVVKRADRAGVAGEADAGGATAGLAAVKRELEELAKKVDGLVDELDGLDTAAIHQRVDPLLTGHCYRFVEGRQVLSAAFGAVGFAHVMGPFAAGERQLNRAWSASVDRNLDEARECVRCAAPLLHEALEAFPAP